MIETWEVCSGSGGPTCLTDSGSICAMTGFRKLFLSADPSVRPKTQLEMFKL